MPDAMPATSRNGSVVTFYSYKGGTGRTMALANIAWILASNGYRVLAADWDLESPGLHRFFAPFLDGGVSDAPGIIDMVRDYEWHVKEALQDVSGTAEANEGLRTAHIAQDARIQRFAIPLKHWTFPEGGSLDFLSPGRQNKDYLATLSSLDWDNFYKQLSGGAFLDALRRELKANYDYALIDGRTGLSDLADVCTVHLPDVLVDCFTLSNQGVDGAAEVAKTVQELYGYRIRVLPVPMRVDPAEKERAEIGRLHAQRRFEGLPVGLNAVERRLYWANVEVPYRTYYAYEEMLAVFGDTSGDPGSMLSAYERIARYITDGAVMSLPVIDDGLRRDTRARFDRRPPLETRRITVEYLPQDHLWAEWITAALVPGGFVVHERQLGQDLPDPGSGAEDPHTLTVVSEAYLTWRQEHAENENEDGWLPGESFAGNGQPRPTRPGAAVSVLNVPRSLEEFAPEATIQLGGLRSGDEAVARLARHYRFDVGAEGQATVLPRFPGAAPAQRGVPAPVASFTGREQELRELRAQLRNSNIAVVRPVALLGSAGAGKTAIAREYVHRYMNDYDLVFWIPCGPSAQIDLRIAELELVLEERFGRRIPTDATVGQRANAVLNVLSDGKTVPRWLLVYDNAEEIETVRQLLPSSGGQVLITSQNQAWEQQGVRLLKISMFDREESLAYLRQEVPHIRPEDAAELAETLGDMPLALSAAAAHLRCTGDPVAGYLSDLTLPRPAAAAGSALSAYPAEVVAALDAPLALLREQSPAAYRLLQLCSVMAPEIGRDLVYSNAMAETLRPLDPALVEPIILRRLVKEASSLNLLTADSATGVISMHRVVHGVIRELMTAGEADKAREEVQRILLVARPRRDVDDAATWSRYALIWPHLPWAGVVSSENEWVRQLVIDRVRAINIFGDDARGEAEGNAAAARWEEMRAAAADPAAERALRTQLFQLRFNIANCLRGQAKFTESRKMHDEVFKEQASLLGADHPHTLMTAGSLAADLRALGLYREALELDQQTHPNWVSLFGDDNLWSLRAGNNLAVSYRLTGDVHEALDLDRKTYEQAKKSLPKEHSLTLASARNLARDLIECGEYKAAVEASLDAYRTSAQYMGADSAGALEALVLLGIARRSAGRPQEAMSQFEEALSLLRTRFSETGNATLACRLSYAINLVMLDRPAKAEEEMRFVHAEYRRNLGPRHPYSLVSQVNLATALRELQNTDQAEAMVAAALDGLRSVLGPEHPHTLAAAMVSSVLRVDQGAFQQAADAGSRIATALARTLGPAHPDALRCRANLLLTRGRLGDDTATDLARVIGQLEHALGEGHPTVATLRQGRLVLRALDPPPF